MKLSEAIRLGAMLNPQGFGHNRIYGPDGTKFTCALGAAEEAGYNFAGILTGPLVFHPPIKCPACACYFYSEVPVMIVHLNDLHRWTREGIADWVATVEPADDPRPGPDAPRSTPAPALLLVGQSQ